MRHHFRQEALEDAPDNIRELVEKAKEEGRDSLTDEEKQAIKDYFNSVRPDRPDRDDIDGNVEERIQALLQKVREEGRDSLTRAEVRILVRWFNAQN